MVFVRVLLLTVLLLFLLLLFMLLMLMLLLLLAAAAARLALAAQVDPQGLCRLVARSGSTGLPWERHFCFGLHRCPIDMVQVARVPISTMGNPNLLLEFTNSALLGRTARSKLVVFRGRWAKH